MSQYSSRSGTQPPVTGDALNNGVGAGAGDEPSLTDQIAELVKRQQSGAGADAPSDTPTSTPRGTAANANSTGAAADLPPLPPDWAARVDARTGKTFYYNKVTKATTWRRPVADPSAASSPSNGAASPTSGDGGSSSPSAQQAPVETPGDDGGAAPASAATSQPQQQQQQQDDGAATTIQAAAAAANLQQTLSFSALVSMAVVDVMSDAAVTTAKASTAVPARVSLVGSRLLVKTSITSPVGYVDVVVTQRRKALQPRIALLPDGETIAIVVEHSPDAAGVSDGAEEPAAAEDETDTNAAAAAQPKKVTRKVLFVQPAKRRDTHDIVAALNAAASTGAALPAPVAAAAATTASAISSSDAAALVQENTGGNLFKLEIAAALSGLFRRSVATAAAASVGSTEDESVTSARSALFALTTLHLPFLRETWFDVAKSAFDGGVALRIDAYHDAAVAMLQRQAAQAQRQRAEHEAAWKQAADAQTAQLAEELAAVVRERDDLLEQIATGGGGGSSSAAAAARGASAARSGSHSGGRNNNDNNRLAAAATSRSPSAVEAANDLVTRLMAQYQSDLALFADQTHELQTRFVHEARRMANVLAQKAHQDELLMQSAPALGASAEEHIRHRRTLEEAFKSLQILHGETSAELEASRRRGFELKAELGGAQDRARQQIEQERERSQAALRSVQIEATDHMKHLAATVDTMRAEHAEELDRMRASHEEAMGVLGKKLHISEAKMLRAVEETEKAKFALTQRGLADAAKIAELKRQMSALELTISELRKAVNEQQNSLQESKEAAARATDRKAAAELARFKRTMIDRTLAGGGRTSPGGTPIGNGSFNNSGVLAQPHQFFASPNSNSNNGNPNGGLTPRSALNIGVGDTSAGHELYNTFRAGGSVAASGQHTLRAMRETSEAVAMLSPRSPYNNSPVAVEEPPQYFSSSSNNNNGVPSSVPRLNFAHAVRTPRDGFAPPSAAAAGAGNTSARGGSMNRGSVDTPRSTFSARNNSNNTGIFGVYDNPAAQSAPVPESETYRKLHEISSRLKEGLVALGAGTAGEARRRHHHQSALQ